MANCNRQHLQRLLDESLPETTERDVAEHVAVCPDCQNELETLAAGKVWWAEAHQRLSKSSLALVPGDSGQSSRLEGDGDADGSPHFGSSHDDDALNFANDFAVDFLDPSDDATKLGRLGDYEIVEVIGRGGMGVVLKGFQTELHRFVAVKVLAPHLATSGAARRRFAREAQATAAIVHPHVMAIHSVHANVKLPYLVMPFVACESLQQRIDRQGPLDVIDVLRIGMQAALGLAAAHAQGLVHRDVKPANILLETTVDRVMLTDFGLARAVDDATLTRTGVIAGTPQYMSPEQANGDAIDHRSDLFSLGGVLYAMCTGRPPFRAETTFGVLRRIREASPRLIREINADIPEWLERIVMRLLSKDAASRIDSAERVASLLERCLAHVQQPTTMPLPKEVDEWVPRPVPVVVRKSRRIPATFWTRVLPATAILVAIVLVVMRPRIEPVPKEEIKDQSTAHSLDPTLSDPRLQWDAMRTDLNDADQAFEPIEAAGKRAWDALAADSLVPTDSNRQDKP